MKYIYLVFSFILWLMDTAFCQKADMVLINGNLITLRGKGDRAQALAIKDGKILAVGSSEEISGYADDRTRRIDLEGRTVVPGFNDVHQHPAPLYTWDKPYARVRLDTVNSMESLVALLRRKAAVTPGNMPVRGTAYNEIKLGGQPTRDILDRASTDHPIIISHASGHLSAVNSYVLRVSGIDQNTKDPPGGALERNKEGVPDGILKESAARLIAFDKFQAVPRPTRAEELDGYRKYFEALLSSGLTSIGDCWVTPEKAKMYQELQEEHFPMRFNLYIGVDYLDKVFSGEIPRIESPWLRIEGIKLFHGNSLSGKTCWLYDPYDTINPASGKKDYYGIPPARSQTSLDSLVLRIHRAGLQIACHSNGDREIDMVINSIERAQKTDFRPDARHRIEHCSITNQGIMDRISKDSIIPVFHCYINELGDQLIAYGPNRWSMLIPTRTALEMAIPFALHSDYPVSRYEAMVRLGSAVNRRTRSGIILGANQKLGVEDAIGAYTFGGAYTSHEEGVKGRIRPGQYADLVVLDGDPTAVDPEKIDSIQVVMTLVGGNIVFGKN